MKIKELLTDESKWIKHNTALTAVGSSCAPTDPDAVKWCLYGAFLKCYRSWYEHLTIERTLIDAINSTSKSIRISNWNDAPERTFAEVKALVEQLDV